jgi:hypothetical protein
MNLVRFSLGLCSIGFCACSFDQLKTPPTPEFKHQHEAAYAAQVKLLSPEEFSINGSAETFNDTTHTYLNVFVHNPQNQPEAEAMLAERVKKLAHLLVIDLKNPDDFEAVSIRVQTDHDYLVAQTMNARNFLYPLDSLK